MISKRTFVIGDIHSGLKGLEQVLSRAKVTPEDKIIFLGDYIDGWSSAVETIDFLIALGRTHNCVFIRGNHDELCYDWLYLKKDNPTWFEHGGKATMASYKKASTETINKHKTFYHNLENYHLDSENRLFLHAGFTNLKGIGYEYFTKTFYWDRTLWEMARSLDSRLDKNNPRYPKRLTNYKEIFIGHTPISKTDETVVPVNEANVWNIDTGAAFKGPLSILNIDTKEVWQSDPLHTLYPNENGRN